MKRSWCLSLWMTLAAVAILVTLVQPVKAQTPASTPTPTPAIPANAQPVEFGTPITSVSLSKTVPAGGKADFKVDSSQELQIMKDFEQQGTVERFQYAAGALTQKQVLQQYIDPDDPGYVWSGVIRICRSTGGAGSTDVTQSRFVTKTDSEKHLLSDLYNVSGKIAAILDMNYSLTKDAAGNYIRAKQPSVISSTYQPPCDTNGTGVTALPKPIALAEGWWDKFLHWLFGLGGSGGSQTVTATAVGKEVSDGANRFVKLLTGKDVGPLTDLPPDEQPKVAKAKGALASLLPGNATFKSDNGQILNFTVSADVSAPPTGTPVPTTAGRAQVQGDTTNAIPVNYPEGYVKDYDTQLLCWATQKGDPNRPPESNCSMTTTNVSGGDCSSDTTGKFTLDANITQAIQAGTAGKMPACIIEGVKFIESGLSWNQNGQCIINECGAAGPFAISVGVDGNGDKFCKQCNAYFADGTHPCNDEWAPDWPTDPSQPSPCNVTLAASRIVELIAGKARNYSQCDLGTRQELTNAPAPGQRDLIIMAGNRYLGSSQSFPSLGNCSYGELVYKHCDPTYCCGSHNIQLKECL